MNSKHLSTGSEEPHYNGEKPRIYSMRFCPYAQRALLVAFAKGIDFEVVNVHLKLKPEWLFVKNPLGKVPAYETSEGVLFESLILCDYLEEKYPDPVLYPNDSFLKALDKIWVDRFGKVTTNFYAVFLKRDQREEMKKCMDELAKDLSEYDKELAKRGTKFFGGDKPGMLDYMIWPWIERLPAFRIIFPDIYDYDGAKQSCPQFEQWRQAMKEDEAVKKTYVTPENHVKFIKTFMNGGMPDYDMLAE